MVLDRVLRPMVLFDPSNKKHRKYYADFLKEGSWGSCPVRFEAEGEASNNNLAFAMQRLLVEFYMAKEFKVKPKVVSTDDLV